MQNKFEILVLHCIKYKLSQLMRLWPIMRFGRILHLLPYFMCANSKGSGETARMHRLARVFAGRLCDKYHNLMRCLNCFHSMSTEFNQKRSQSIFQRKSPSEPQHDKTNKMACVPSEDSDKPGHPQIRVFAVRMKKPWVLS